MNVSFHRRVQNDLKVILLKYDEVSDSLGDDFMAEFQLGVGRVCENPQFFHFDQSGLRRYNLDRFPYRLSAPTGVIERKVRRD